MVAKNLKLLLEKQQYRIIGNHSACKICLWCKKSLRRQYVCYKEKFYDIQSHRCIQMTPSVFYCTQNCSFCWRTMKFNLPIKNMKWDKPEIILNGCIDAQRELLSGFKGYENIDMEKWKQAQEPNQIAISLAGEPCLYPYLPEFIDLTKSRKMTSFLVTNGTIPKMIEKLRDHQPTQLYITLPAPSEKVYNTICNPIFKDGWKRIHNSLKLLKEFDRSVIRLTMVKGLNMIEAERYASIIAKAEPKFVEIKAFMSLGGARARLGIDKMPFHSDIKEFAQKINKELGYKFKDENEKSRVVLLCKKK